jgi:hypothetical protein
MVNLLRRIAAELIVETGFPPVGANSITSQQA